MSDLDDEESVKLEPRHDSTMAVHSEPKVLQVSIRDSGKMALPPLTSVNPANKAL
ncbi:hypothetical protein E8E13_002204 [Curvularia kusanoi]|uniref:Uncharacterized protein n=1 Tax=Curvularia kusanoi TaxID=90978 RepID=A0A9P4T827_CURKU|nr:hypothetical protein E8E13_002204 [Curvularia kusanoi]